MPNELFEDLTINLFLNESPKKIKEVYYQLSFTERLTFKNRILRAWRRELEKDMMHCFTTGKFIIFFTNHKNKQFIFDQLKHRLCRIYASFFSVRRGSKAYKSAFRRCKYELIKAGREKQVEL